MSNEVPADENMFQWETNTDEVADGGVGGKENFGMVVDWPVEGKWVNTSKDDYKTSAISRYKLEKGSGLFYEYTLQFDCSQHYDYYFFDETGDSYEVNVYLNGQHSVQYNSEKPKINYVKGS
jgi:hypothetical protein